MNPNVSSKRVQDVATMAISLAPECQREFVQHSLDGDAEMEREVLRLIKSHLKNSRSTQDRDTKLSVLESSSTVWRNDSPALSVEHGLTPVGKNSADKETRANHPKSHLRSRRYEISGRQIAGSASCVAAVLIATLVGWSSTIASSNRSNEALSSAVEELSQDVRRLEMANAVGDSLTERMAELPPAVWR